MSAGWIPHLFRTALAALVVTCLSTGPEAWANATGVNGYSGAANADCTACHGGNANRPTVEISGGNTLPGGQVANFELVINGGPAVRAGFNISVSSTGSPATLAPVDTNAQLRNGELTHVLPYRMAGQLRIPFRITTPSNGGTLRISAAALSANGNGNDGGDGVRTTQTNVTVTPSANQNQGPALSGNPTATVNGMTAALRVTATDDGGEAALSYQWAVVSGPGRVTFAANESNGAKNTTATFVTTGTYLMGVTVRDAQGLSAFASMSVSVTGNSTSPEPLPEVPNPSTPNPTTPIPGNDGLVIWWIQPLAQEILTGLYPLDVDITNNAAVSTIVFRMDAQKVGESKAAPWKVDLDTCGYANGEHVLSVTGLLADGSSREIEERVVQIQNAAGACAGASPEVIGGCSSAGGTGALAFAAGLVALRLARRRKSRM